MKKFWNEIKNFAKKELNQLGMKALTVLLVAFIIIWTPVWSVKNGSFVWSPIMIGITIYAFTWIVSFLFKNWK